MYFVHRWWWWRWRRWRFRKWACKFKMNKMVLGRARKPNPDCRPSKLGTALSVSNRSTQRLLGQLPWLFISSSSDYQRFVHKIITSKKGHSFNIMLTILLLGMHVYLNYMYKIIMGECSLVGTFMFLRQVQDMSVFDRITDSGWQLVGRGDTNDSTLMTLLECKYNRKLCSSKVYKECIFFSFIHYHIV